MPDRASGGGACFDPIDGTDETCLAPLRRALAASDVVILQPGYVCQAVCRGVESHCERDGVRRVQLDKACVPGFAQSLAAALATD